MPSEEARRSLRKLAGGFRFLPPKLRDRCVDLEDLQGISVRRSRLLQVLLKCGFVRLSPRSSLQARRSPITMSSSVPARRRPPACRRGTLMPHPELATYFAGNRGILTLNVTEQ